MTLEAFLKRYFWAVVLPLIGVAAYFQASGITQIVGSALSVDEKALVGSGAQGPNRSVATVNSSNHHTAAQEIIERNPFDSVKGNLNPPIDMGTASGPALPATDDPYSAPPCDGVKILATAVSQDAAWSFAALTGGTGEGSVSKLRRQGDDYATKKVWFIRWDRVWLIAPGSFCQVEMFARAADVKAAASSAPPAAASAPPTTKGVPAVADDIKSKIRRNSATSFDIDRSAVDKLLENQQGLMSAARVVPEIEGGKTVGVRMYGIRPDTLLGALGMETGDRLEKINGFDMTSPEKALEAYAKLRTADKLQVSLNRRGQAMNIDYNIK